MEGYKMEQQYVTEACRRMLNMDLRRRKPIE